MTKFFRHQGDHVVDQLRQGSLVQPAGLTCRSTPLAWTTAQIHVYSVRLGRVPVAITDLLLPSSRSSQHPAQAAALALLHAHGQTMSCAEAAVLVCMRSRQSVTKAKNGDWRAQLGQASCKHAAKNRQTMQGKKRKGTRQESEGEMFRKSVGPHFRLGRAVKYF